MDRQDWQIRFFAARVNSLNASDKGKIRQRDNLDLLIIPSDEIFSSHLLSEKR